MYQTLLDLVNLNSTEADGDRQVMLGLGVAQVCPLSGRVRELLLFSCRLSVMCWCRTD